ncbi:hypothetical protein BDN72DRAFT_781409 [Pluteus cervinus]|uniref:Uncharacterized protein n=1 Tax=Pluteus cervinus TaxID=181527 RepID=A0ACD2ZZT6_9AGAR|nr:hypothetical protein BDN72DRAFT_781409 [Pluteus cervinus]
MDPAYDFNFDELTNESAKRQRSLGSVSGGHISLFSSLNIPQEHPLLNWIPYRDQFLQESIRLEGRGLEDGATMVCGSCGESDAPAYHRCESCFDFRFFCGKCIVRNHAANPLHWVQEWNGTFLFRRSLSDLGLKVQLGHPIGEECPSPLPVKGGILTILHINGVHSVRVNYCRCHRAKNRFIQLLRFRLFPATVISPQTAASFELLNFFQLLGFMSKASGFELFQTLTRLTSNIGNPVPNRYKALMCMLREWRHIRLMKRMGQGHKVGGINSATEGSCAVLCPACPQPGINLPPDYNDGPLSKTWIYSLFIAIDANFRLKRLDVSSDISDPDLNGGTAFVVNEKNFKAFLKEFGEKIPDDTSTCNNHDAIKSASVRGGKGIAASGVGTVDCRHDMKRPTSIGDLQKGERYVNMDYMVVSSLKQNAPQRVSPSYDIMCQYIKHFLERLALYAPVHAPNLKHDFDCFIPKWHIAAHRASCQTDYSFYWSPYVGRTDGEAPERGWAAMNGIAASTKEMGPGSRRDTLDDFFGDYNWRKVITISEALFHKVQDAVPERSEHVVCFIELCDAIAETSPEILAVWMKMVQDWEKDRTKPNPFTSTQQGLTIHQVRLELATEDQDRIAKEKATEVQHEVRPSEMLSQGIELEDLQASLEYDYAHLSLHPTPLQSAKLLERRGRLLRRILDWIKVQKGHMPGISALRKDCSALNKSIAEAIPLLMPSDVMKKLKVSQELLEYEWRYRIAQIGTTLDDLRRHLLLRDQMYSSKDRHVRGQRANTRSKGVLDRVQEKVNNDAKKYRRILQQLTNLATVAKNDGTWKATWLPLNDSDISGLKNFDEGIRPTLANGRPSIGKWVLSWIWRRTGFLGGVIHANEGKQAVRIEWCKSRARAHRWQEECHLLKEEMRRVKTYFKYRADEWLALAAASYNAEDEGRRAYAARQAAIFSSMYIRCISDWKDCEAYFDMGEGTTTSVITGDDIRIEYSVPTAV